MEEASPSEPTALPTPNKNPKDEDDGSLEDSALEYIESEVGRLDWKTNWRQRLKKGDERKNIEAWATHVKSQHTAEDIFTYIETQLMLRQGRWM